MGSAQLLQSCCQHSTKLQLISVVQPHHREALRRCCLVEGAVSLLLCCHRLAGEGMRLFKMLRTVHLHQQVCQAAASCMAIYYQICRCIALQFRFPQQAHLRHNAAGKASGSQRLLRCTPCRKLRLGCSLPCTAPLFAEPASYGEAAWWPFSCINCCAGLHKLHVLAARQPEEELGGAAGIDIGHTATHQLAKLWVEGI